MGLTSVMINYRTPGDADEFLASYERDPVVPSGSSLIVVNVDPTERDGLVVERWCHRIPEMRAITFTENVGYARACNRAAAIDAPGGDVLAFFNADVVLRPRALAECYEAIRENKEWGALGPRQVDEHDRLTSTGVYGPPTQPAFGAWLAPDTGQWSEVRDDALTVSGSAYFIRRTVWDLMATCPVFRAVAPDAEGALLPTEHFYEETFLSGHLRAHGYRVTFFGPTCIVHKWHRASPHGGFADQKMSASRAIYRAACDAHGIERE